jgi:hypothetical protein
MRARSTFAAVNFGSVVPRCQWADVLSRSSKFWLNLGDRIVGLTHHGREIR